MENYKIEFNTSCLSFENQSDENDCLNLVVGAYIKPVATECFKIIGKDTKEERLTQSESKAEKRKRELIEEEEAVWETYKSNVFKEHEETSIRSSESCKRARKETNRMGKTIRENRNLSLRFDEAVEKFNNTCLRKLQRCIEDENHTEAVRKNSGKELNFFKEPALLLRQRLRVKQNTM